MRVTYYAFPEEISPADCIDACLKKKTPTTEASRTRRGGENVDTFLLAVIALILVGAFVRFE